MNLLEKDMENLILKDSKKYLNEDGLKLVSRQYSIGHYRFDLLFEDRHSAKLIVEIQRGTLDRNHTYKILDYYDEFKERNPNEFVELMVIANKIPRERRNRLKSMGVTFKEIPQSVFLEDPNFKDINDLNFQDKEHPKPKTVENKLGSNHTAPTGDPLNGKHRFEGLIERVTWKAECVKLSEMTNNRKTQLVKIFKIYGGLSIPYSHFTVERSKIKSLSNSQIFPVICAYHIGCFDKLENELTLKKDYVKDFSQYFLEIDKLVENKSRQHKLPAELTKLENCGLVSIIDQIVDEVGGNWNDWEIRNAYDVSRELTIMGPDGGKYRIKLWGKAVGDGYVCIEMRGDKRAMERLKRDLSIEKLIRRDNCFYPTKFGSKGQRTKDVNELKQRINKLKTIAQASAVDMLDVDIKKFLSECY